LGAFNVELIEPCAARVLDDQAALVAIGSLAGLARLLPDRDPHPVLYAEGIRILQALDDDEVWPASLVRWELLLLQDLGFGLDLSACAATGAGSDLVYVSPRSGRAVSREAGKPYGDRLLKLPAFLLDDTAEATRPDIVAGFALTGHFFERHVLAPHGLAMPQARERLIGLLGREPQVAVMPGQAER
jgi:DNA repair protein RecO (recombination protein O)